MSHLKMQNICNLIGWKSVHISDIFKARWALQNNLNLYKPKTCMCRYRLGQHLVVLNLYSVSINKILNSQENTCARVSFLIKLQAPPATLLKKRLWHRCFPVNFAKFLRTPFSKNTSGRLLLERRTNCYEV